MRKILMSVCVGVMFLAGGASARDEFIEVTHQDLLEYPQKYWSQGIIFKDKLVSPPKGRSITLGIKSYVPFKTENLGTCYIEKDLVDMIKSSEMDKDYIFQGTVLHQPSSFFSRSPSFYVVVQRLAKAVAGVEQAQERLFEEGSAVGTVVDEIITQIQQDLISYAQKNNVAMSELFASDYEKKGVVNNIIYAGIAAVEQKNGTTARALLGDFIREVFVAEYTASGMGGVREDTSVVIMSEEAPASEPEVVSPPAADEQDEPAPDEEANIKALRKRAAIMLKPGISLPTAGKSGSSGASPVVSPVESGEDPASRETTGKLFRNAPE